jgi:hypothetical protein
MRRPTHHIGNNFDVSRVHYNRGANRRWRAFDRWRCRVRGEEASSGAKNIDPPIKPKEGTKWRVQESTEFFSFN